MDRFIMDLAAEAKAREGVWVTCDDEGVAWCGARFLFRPMTVSVAQSLSRGMKAYKNSPRKSALFQLKTMLLDHDGLGTGDREATLEEVHDYFSEVPQFLAWMGEKCLELAAEAHEAAEADLGN